VSPVHLGNRSGGHRGRGRLSLVSGMPTRWTGCAKLFQVLLTLRR